MSELKAYALDPDKNLGWSFDIDLLKEIQKEIEHRENAEQTSLEQVDSLLQSVLKRFSSPQLPDPCTPEQYEQITGERFPEDGVVWEFDEWSEYKISLYSAAKKRRKLYNCGHIAIAQTGKGCPPADWRPEE